MTPLVSVQYSNSGCYLRSQPYHLPRLLGYDDFADAGFDLQVSIGRCDSVASLLTYAGNLVLSNIFVF